MSCTGERNRQARCLASEAKVAPGQIDAGERCPACSTVLTLGHLCPQCTGGAGVFRFPPPAGETAGETQEFAQAVRRGPAGPPTPLAAGMTGAQIVAYIDDGRGVRKPRRAAYCDPDDPNRYLHDGDSEVVACHLAGLLGLQVVPETVYEGAGETTTQRFVEDGQVLAVAVGKRGAAAIQALLAQQEERVWTLLALDLITGNNDRNPANVVFDPQGQVWAVDHGNCTWQRFGPGDAARPLAWNYLLMYFQGRSPDPRQFVEVPHGRVVFPPAMVERWRQVTAAQFQAAFAGVAADSHVRPAAAWQNLQDIVARNGVVQW